MEIDCGNYILKSDPQCMWIEKKITVKKGKSAGKEYSRRVSGYCMNFQQLLENFAEHMTRESDAHDMQELLKDLTTIEKDMQAIAANAAGAVK